MGMYTELYLGVDLKKDTPMSIINWLNANQEFNYKEATLKCPTDLKNTQLSTLRGGGSYYFYAQPHFNFKYDEISESYHLTLGINIQNYDNEIDSFLQLLRPYLYMEDGEHMGHVRYKEDTTPTLLYV